MNGVDIDRVHRMKRIRRLAMPCVWAYLAHSKGTVHELAWEIGLSISAVERVISALRLECSPLLANVLDAEGNPVPHEARIRNPIESDPVVVQALKNLTPLEQAWR